MTNGRRFEALEVEREGHVATVTLTRPDLLNRVDETLHEELAAVLASLRGEPVRAIVLASTGPVFSAGGDFDYMRRLHDDPEYRTRNIDLGRRLFASLVDVPQPVVVALHGDAIGLGATVVLTGDAVVAARQAGLADPHVAIGLVAGDGGCVVWPAAAGMVMAKRYLLTGDRLTAEDARAIGLVTDLVDGPEEVLPAARALADRMATLPPLAVQGTKRALNRVLQQRAGEVLDLSFALESQSVASDDLLEAIAAFRERRRGSYRGR